MLAGTGNSGKIIRFGNGEVETIFESPDQIVITELIQGEQGTVYAGGIPGKQQGMTDGKIYRISGDDVEEVARLTDSFIWDLETGPEGNLYAATGPDGTIYRISPDGETTEFYRTGQAHVMSLAVAPDGTVHAGTAMNGRVFAVEGPGSGEVLYEFNEQEIRGLAYQNGNLLVGGNQLRQFNPRRFVDRLRSAVQQDQQGVAPDPVFESLMGGSVYRLNTDGEVTPLLSFQERYLTSLSVNGSGNIIATTGDIGRVYRVNPEDRSHSLLHDFGDRQAMDVAFNEQGNLHAAVTANPATIQDLSGSDRNRVYTSGIRDMGYTSQLGRIRWGAEGEGSLQIQTRTGNTDRPDESWSSWSDPISEPGTHTGSPAGRFVQVRIRWEPNNQKTLRYLRIPYLSRNQQPYIENLNVENNPDRPGYSGEQQDRQTISIEWSAQDPDEDRLLFEVYARKQGADNWMPLNGGDPLTNTSFSWNINFVADGRYEIRVTASDRLDNPEERALSGSARTGNVLVDREAPSFDSLQITEDHEIEANVTDSLSPVARVEYRLGHERWQLVFPEDGMYDGPEEAISTSLATDQLTPGTHQVTLRAFDAAGNTTTRQITFTVE